MKLWNLFSLEIFFFLDKLFVLQLPFVSWNCYYYKYVIDADICLFIELFAKVLSRNYQEEYTTHEHI